MSMTTDKQASRQIKVLIIEDHLLTRLGLKSAIGLSGDIDVVCESETAEDGLEKLSAQAVDIVILDLGLPKMNGIEAAKCIREKYPNIGIVILTSHTDAPDISACFAAGANAYCTKDVKPDRLFTAIRSVYQGDVWLDANIAAKVLSDLSQRGHNGAGSDGHEKIAPSGCDGLSARELEVLQLLVQGMTNQEIADKLIISLATAKAHVRSIFNKLAVDDRTQAAVEAMRRGLA